MAIPKIIHYCWFGGNPMDAVGLHCIESWKRYAPDFELRRWDESNFDTDCCPYVREAYDAKKYAFVTDYVRLCVLYEYGGVYFDTDAELIKPLDDVLLSHRGFVGLEKSIPTPYGRRILPATGLGFGCEAHFAPLACLLADYRGASMYKPDGTLDKTTCTQRNLRVFRSLGFNGKNELQERDGFVFYPTEYFAPLDYITGKRRVTANTYGIHLYNGSWRTRGKWKTLKQRFYCTPPGRLFLRIRYGNSLQRFEI